MCVILQLWMFSGNVAWTGNYQAPVVAMYSLDAERGGFRKIPFYNMATETLDHITANGEMMSTEWRSRFLDRDKEQMFKYVPYRPH